MRYVLLLASLLPFAAAHAAWTPNPPYTLTDKGSPLQSADSIRNSLYLATDGWHYQSYYYTPLGSHVAQLVDIALTNGTTRVRDMAAPYTPGAHPTVYYPSNNTVWVAEDGYLFEFAPTSGATNAIPITAGGGGNGQVSPNGFIYIGIADGKADRYNPLTGNYAAIGKLDPSVATEQFSYSLGADTRYLYVGLGQSPWYLATWDSVTLAKTNYWKTAGDSFGGVYHGTAGGLYYRRVDSGGTNYWYSLTNGVATLVGSVPSVIDWEWQRGNVIDGSDHYASSTGYTLDLSLAMPNSAATNATFLWRSSTNVWQSNTVSTISLEPAVIHKLWPWSSTRMLAAAEGYGPLFWYELATNGATFIGNPTVSLYDGEWSTTNLAFLSGYPTASLRWAPASPWTLFASTTNRYSPTVNPYLLSADWGTYYYYTAMGADGLLYVAADHQRDSEGGELGWYDPSNSSTGSLRAPFLTTRIRGLAAMTGGRIVLSTDTNLLYVVSQATKTVERTIQPLSGTASLDKIVEAEPGYVYGVAANRAFKVRAADGAILYTNLLPGVAFGSNIPSVDRRLVKGPDGYIWFWIGGDLYRVNPATGTPASVLTAPAYSLTFNGGDLWLFGRTNLTVVSNALISRAYYIDYAAGSDANSGTTTASPWKHHPYMRAFSGAYAHVAGDRFIFKGGVTWPVAAFQLAIPAGGTPTSPDYYGVDLSWFSGGSWTRPIWDFSNTLLVDAAGQSNYFHSAAILLDGYSGPALSNITFDSLDVRRFRAPQGAAGYGANCFTERGSVSSVTWQNCLIRDWDLATITTPGQDGSNSGGIAQIDAIAPLDANVITNCTFTTASAAQRTGVAIHGSFDLLNSTIATVCNGIIGGGTWTGNTVTNIVAATDSTAHENAMYLMSPGVVANNLLFDIATDASAIYLSPSFTHPSSGTALCYNNRVWAVGNQAPISIDSEAGDLYGLKVGVACYNNTLEHAAAPCITVGTKAKIGSFTAINNHCITTSPAEISWSPSYVNDPAVVVTNLVQSQATATAQGYTASNLYAPTAGGSTIHNGADLTSTGFNTDCLGALRSSTWDIGAYQFGGVTPPPTQTLAFSAPSYSVSETAGTLTLTIARTGGTTGTATVDWGTVAGSAVPLIDYASGSGTLVFPEGTSEQTVTIAIFNNAVWTGNRSFSAVIGNPSGASLATPASVVITIVEDDPVPPTTNTTVKVHGQARLHGVASFK